MISTVAGSAETGPSPIPLFIADHPALDFVNTAFGIGAAAVECLNDDAQVIAWLRSAGFLDREMVVQQLGKTGELLTATLALRAVASELLASRKAGEATDPALLNRLMARGGRYRQLQWPADGAPVCLHRQRVESVEDLLVPVAEAIAELLADGDFELVRRCENLDCTLWYYDRTKAHRRRWCSMAVCGNRMKVAAFRARQRAE
ncbi:ABATE domain-containing protein [Nevskia sp.]|uniref:CGNR zinc finger domain-containing protein n=1 Tax=Nevskia sp. TaxID=1929292 RepID=UPI0025D0348D|nr:ABATE domain-containing protein [Nevskia sp.]